MKNNEKNLPSLKESAEFIRAKSKKTVPDLLREADSESKILFQPRCGVGGQAEMVELLRKLRADGQPDILSITIDSYTRLKKFDQADEMLRRSPSKLNGYPLVSHGYQRGRELEAAVDVPLEVRHGSPDAKRLFDVAIASGITSFEGGGICYNLPYSKNVSIGESLRAWQYVDDRTGELDALGVTVDRELFGTLSAVLIPPSISLSMTLLEAMLAQQSGVRCLSIAYPQGGNVVQDIAALRAIRVLAERHLSKETRVYPVLHEFMGAFPRDPVQANALIFLGGLVARLGQATKVITKTNKEALGIPSAEANAEGLRTARMGAGPMFGFVRVPEEGIRQERDRIVREVEEIISPVIAKAAKSGLIEAISWGFEEGYLDMPFSTSRFARSEVIPLRDAMGCLRFLDPGRLALSDRSILENRKALGKPEGPFDFVRKIQEDIFYFSEEHYRKSKTSEELSYA